MREILFRGKRKDNGAWVYGYFISQGGDYYIFEQTEVDKGIDLGGYLDCCKMQEIIPETLGEYTGHKDKNDIKIFEGDIVATRKHATRTETWHGYLGYTDDGYPKFVPGYNGSSEYQFSYQADCYAKVVRGWQGDFYLEGTTLFVCAICNEVVGNVYDNPELLKEKTNDQI